MTDLSTYLPQFADIFGRTPQLSNILPSEWAEANVQIPGKGYLNYDYNPFCRKIIDCFAPTHPARKIAVMKSSQITFSSGVIYPLLGYTISQYPRNTSLMVGTEDLVKMAVEKLDYMIDHAKLRQYIKSQSQRKRQTKTGDTDSLKSFADGYILTWAATNPKSVAQMDWDLILLDDYEAMRGKSKTAGSLGDLVEMRAASNESTYKMGMFSTPLLKADSNIEPAFLQGNQELYFIHCPCCHEPIILRRNISEGAIINHLTGETAKGNGGLVYKTDNLDRLVRSSVGYVCYKCAGYFTDKNKQQMLREGDWHPTAVPLGGEDYFSFQINCLYAPIGQFKWWYYLNKELEANPKNQPRDEYKTRTLVNTGWAETYEPPAEETKATDIMRNQRAYEPYTLPEKLSIADGNGRIVLLTLAADMNGKMKGFHGAMEDDVRLDWELVAWAESGACYSIAHGSVGTFIPLEGSKAEKVDRERWTYELNHPRSVWPVLDELAKRVFSTDTGRQMRVFVTGLDSGNYTNFAYSYIDKTNNYVLALKGDKEQAYATQGIDRSYYRDGKEKPGKLYILQVGLLKDDLSAYMKLKWHDGEEQPANFMNFPDSKDGMYKYDNYFEHYEAEHRSTKPAANGSTLYIWKKRRSNAQNHMWDCRVYNMALKEIVVGLLGKELKLKPFSWRDYVEVVTGGK